MKKNIYLLLIFVVGLMLFSSCKDPEQTTSITSDSSYASEEKEVLELNKTSLTLSIGETASVLPMQVEGEVIEYFSGATDVAMVDENGEVTAIGVGTANIYVTVGDLLAVCKVTVVENLIPAYSISIAKEEYLLERGETYTLMPTVLLGNEEIKDAICTFDSSLEDIATVDSTGKITAMKQGNTVITIQYADGLNYICKQVSIVVIRPLNFEISQTELDMTLETQPQLLSARVFDNTTEITDAVFTWYSADDNVVTVNPNTGEVTPISSGETTVYAVYENGRIACNVNIWDSLIYDEQGFMEIYDYPDGRYKLMNDISITSALEVFAPGQYYGYTFNGVIDGGGHTLTIAHNQRIFQSLAGTVRNMKVAGEVTLWGSLIAYELKPTGVIENIDFSITFKSLFTCYDTNGYNPFLAAGVVTENNGLIKDCSVDITVIDNLSLTDVHGNRKDAFGYVYEVEHLSAYSLHMRSGKIENCTATSNKTISFVYGNENAGVVISPIYGETITLMLGETYSVAKNGAEYKSSNPEIVSVSDGGLITALKDGVVTITVLTAETTTIYTIGVWKMISTAAEFLEIYDNPNGYYKLMNDISITSALEVFAPGQYYGYTFNGVIDGGGHTLTIAHNQRIFQSLAGTVRNMKVAGEVTLWGSLIAYELKPTGVIENIDFSITFKSLFTCYDTNGYNPFLAAGVVTENNGLIKDCSVDITVIDDLSLTDVHGNRKDAFGYVYEVEHLSAYSLHMRSGKIENCTAKSNKKISFVYGNENAGVVEVV